MITCVNCDQSFPDAAAIGKHVMEKHLGKRDAAWQALLVAARSRVACGHNDTCSKALNEQYECDCGHDALVTACAEASP